MVMVYLVEKIFVLSPPHIGLATECDWHRTTRGIDEQAAALGSVNGYHGGGS